MTLTETVAVTETEEVTTLSAPLALALLDAVDLLSLARVELHGPSRAAGALVL